MDFEESEKVRWIKQQYQAAPVEGPSAKRVKFDSIREGLLSEFPGKKLSNQKLSKMIKENFPLSVSKREGVSRTTHIVGLEECQGGDMGLAEESETESSNEVSGDDLAEENANELRN